MKNRLWMCGALISGCAVQMNAGWCSEAESESEPGVYGKALQVVFDVREDLQTHFSFSFTPGEGATAANETVIANSELKLSSFDSMLDWHPVTGGFFVSGGAVTGLNKISALTQGSTLQGKVAPFVTGTQNGTADLRNVAPYLGLGWASKKTRKKGWGLTGDIGILYRGRTTLSLNNTGCLLANVGAFSLCQGVDYGGGSVNDVRNSIRYVPVLRAGISYRF